MGLLEKQKTQFIVISLLVPMVLLVAFVVVPGLDLFG
jgi:hypothetical protein